MSRLRLDLCALVLAALPVVWLGQAGTAEASLIGDKVTAEVLFAGKPSGQGPSTAIVDDGLEFDFINVDIDVRAEGADYRMILPGVTVFSETYLLTDLDWTDDPGRIVGAEIELFGRLSKIPVLSWTHDSVAVTLPSMTRIERGAFIRVNFDVKHRPVPEPGATALFATGFGIVALALRRRR